MADLAAALVPALLVAAGSGLVLRAPSSVPWPALRPAEDDRRRRLAWWVAGVLRAAAIAMWWGGPAGVGVGAVAAPATAEEVLRAVQRARG